MTSMQAWENLDRLLIEHPCETAPELDPTS